MIVYWLVMFYKVNLKQCCEVIQVHAEVQVQVHVKVLPRGDAGGEDCFILYSRDIFMMTMMNRRYFGYK